MDILILIALTAFLIYRLMTMLGTKTGQEKNRSFLTNAAENIIVLPRKKNQQTEENNQSIPDYQINILSKVRDELPDFDTDDFLDNAKNAYQFIIKRFVQGKKDALKQFVTPSVYDAFCQMIDNLKEQNLEQESEIVDFLSIDVEKSEIDESDMFNRKVCITLLFKTKQINVVYNDKGEIIENPAKISAPVSDLWTFERSILSSEPTWLLSKMKRVS